MKDWNKEWAVFVDDLNALRGRKREYYVGENTDEFRTLRIGAQVAGIPLHRHIAARITDKIMRFAVGNGTPDKMYRDALDIAVYSFLEFHAWLETYESEAANVEMRVQE